MVYYLLLSQQIPLYLQNISAYRTKYVRTGRNPMFCTYVLHKRHGQFFGAHSKISYLNSG